MVSSAMDGFQLNAESIATLLSCVGRRADQLVWDLDAIYIVQAAAIVKIESLTDVPIPDTWSEIAYLAVSVDPVGAAFKDPAPAPYGYKIVDRGASIIRIDLVRTIVLLPQGRIQHPSAPIPEHTQAFTVDCGVLLRTPAGIVPAIQFENSFGFLFLRDKRLYSQAEIDDLLADKYEVVAL